MKQRNTTRLLILLLCVFSGAVWLTLHPLRAISSSTIVDTHAGIVNGKNSDRSVRFGSLPLRFELNVGQTDRQARFIASTSGGDTFLTPSEMVLRVRETSAGRPKKSSTYSASAQSPAFVNTAVVRLRTVGANPKAHITGLDPLPGKTNYFVGNDPKKWRTNVSSFARVKYESVYPGIDLIYYGHEGNLEYDFDVAPGADPSRIALSVEGADAIHIDDAGNLVLHTAVGEVSQHAPRIYQEVNGTRREIQGSYKLLESKTKFRDPKSAIRNRVAFTLGDYDKTKPLVIDPQLVYATYFGGSSETDIKAIAVDSTGAVYVAGDTFAHDFPTKNPLQSTNKHAPALSAVISKLSPDGQSLVYSTYLGGSDTFANDVAVGIALDSTGAAYITGSTGSSDFPTKNPIQGARSGSATDVFVSKLSADGSALIYSTYLGGTAFDEPNGLKLDSANAVYVFGQTSSTDFPTVNPTQAAFAGGQTDGFLSIINGNGTQLLFSTYVGHTGDDTVSSCAIDVDTGSVYLGGFMPLTTQPAKGLVPETGKFEKYVEKLKRELPGDYELVKDGIKYLLTNPQDLGSVDEEIRIDIIQSKIDQIRDKKMGWVDEGSGAPTVEDFDDDPLPPSQDDRPEAADPGIRISLAELDTNIPKTVHFGGNGLDLASGLIGDSQGAVYVVGQTSSRDFPTVNPIQGTYGGSIDAFVAVFAPDTLNEVFATYLGGSGHDIPNGIALDSQGNIYIAGQTTSDNFPTKNAFQPTAPAPNGVQQGQGNSFIAKISAVGPFATPTPTPTPTSTPTPPPNLVQFSSPTYSVQEDCTFINITVNRTGDTSGAATVDYATSDGTATARRDYITALGTLRFAPGETSKTIAVLINEDSYVEGNETFNITLSNPSGVSLGTSAATITILDDPTEPTTNAIDDTPTFVCQQYHDFLNRQADAPGQAFWTSEITSCSTNAACIEAKRVNTSGAFYLSIEFQQTGYLVERMYKTAYGGAIGASSLGGTQHSLSVPIIRLGEFLPDTQRIGQGVIVGQGDWQTALENNKAAFALEFVQRSRFTSSFPTTQTPVQFVDALNGNAGNVLSAAERATAINFFAGAGDTTNTTARAQALRFIAEDSDLVSAEFNRAFVLMEYFGYLRRDPNATPDSDYAGFEFWLQKLNQFNGSFLDAEMVKAFLSSIEYRQRFGP